MSKRNPCYGCERRKVTREYNCHSHCPDYIGLKEEAAAKASAIKKKKRQEAMVTSVRLESIRKSARKQNVWKG